ncbi:MAG: chemotaxis protein CheB, partial [Myxococcales bacterium]
MTKKKTAAKVTGGAVPNASPTRSSDTAELPTLGNAESIFPTGSGAPTNLIVVGIGASAGGLAAFEAFLSGVPDNVDSGVAFVLVQHLAPDHKSALTELVRRYTPMR